MYITAINPIMTTNEGTNTDGKITPKLDFTVVSVVVKELVSCNLVESVEVIELVSGNLDEEVDVIELEFNEDDEVSVEYEDTFVTVMFCNSLFSIRFNSNSSIPK